MYNDRAFSQDFKNDSDDELFLKWIERTNWDKAKKEADFHIEIANEYSAKHIILDDYRSDFEHQFLLYKKFHIMLQQYDASLYQKFAAQLVINSSPFERREFYLKNFVIQK